MIGAILDTIEELNARRTGYGVVYEWDVAYRLNISKRRVQITVDYLSLRGKVEIVTPLNRRTVLGRRVEIA